PELTGRIDNIDNDVNDAILLLDEDGIITALNEDRTLRIWLRRQTGKYWPSVCNTLESSPTSLYYYDASRLLFCGSDAGLIYEFTVAEDYNKITLNQTYSGHPARIQAVHYSSANNLLLSVSRGKKFHWYSTQNGRLMGTYDLDSWGMAIQ
ncbi:unnamed protein product, partial [Didymodactylos carnosus]